MKVKKSRFGSLVYLFSNLKRFFIFLMIICKIMNSFRCLTNFSSFFLMKALSFGPIHFSSLFLFFSKVMQELSYRSHLYYFVNLQLQFLSNASLCLFFRKNILLEWCIFIAMYRLIWILLLASNLRI